MLYSFSLTKRFGHIHQYPSFESTTIDTASTTSSSTASSLSSPVNTPHNIFKERAASISNDHPTLPLPLPLPLPQTFGPSYSLWQNATMKGWVTKHIPPSFSFIGQKKKRFFILSDRMIYAFKSDQAGSCYRELFQLTKSTQVFVTDHFSGVSNCLEIQKKDENDLSWYFQAPDSATMQVWLQLLKKTILWLRTDPQGPCNPTELISIPNEGDYRYSYMLSTSERSTSRHSQTIMRSSMHSSNNVNTSNARYSATYPSTQFSSIKRSSYSPTTAQGGFMGTLPPPLPPPTHAPPPPPKVFHL